MTELVQYEAMRSALAICARIDEAKDIRDRAAALAAYARQKNDKETEAWLGAIKLRAMIRIGEISAALETAPPDRGHGAGLPSSGKTKADALKEAGLSTSSAQRYEQLAAHKEEAERYLAACEDGKRVPTLSTARQIIKREDRALREVALAEKIKAATATLGVKRYGVIYADPPWRFEPYSRKTGMDRAPENHYPTMTQDALAALEIPAADDCVLFCWATVAMLPAGLAFLSDHGFTYRSAYGWLKPGPGTGYWSRFDQLELLLVGMRGEVPAPAMGTQPPQVLVAPRGRHSEKPAAFAEMIERMFPNLPKLEMFARALRPRWDVSGVEVEYPPPNP